MWNGATWVPLLQVGVYSPTSLGLYLATADLMLAILAFLILPIGLILAIVGLFLATIGLFMLASQFNKPAGSPST